MHFLEWKCMNFAYDFTEMCWEGSNQQWLCADQATSHFLSQWWLAYWRIYVKLQNLSWYKTGFVSRQALPLLSKLQNWFCPQTGQYKKCIVSNTKIEATIRATKPKPSQSHLTSETVEISIQNEKAGLVPMQSRFWCGRFRVGAKPVLVQQV